MNYTMMHGSTNIKRLTPPERKVAYEGTTPLQYFHWNLC